MMFYQKFSNEPIKNFKYQSSSSKMYLRWPRNGISNVKSEVFDTVKDMGNLLIFIRISWTVQLDPYFDAVKTFTS